MSGPTLTLIAKPQKSRSTAILLALLLGGLGIHKFYLDRPGQGFLCILFCWTFIPAIIGLVDGVWLLHYSDAEFQAEYLAQRAA